MKTYIIIKKLKKDVFIIKIVIPSSLIDLINIINKAKSKPDSNVEQPQRYIYQKPTFSSTIPKYNLSLNKHEIKFQSSLALPKTVHRLIIFLKNTTLLQKQIQISCQQNFIFKLKFQYIVTFECKLCNLLLFVIKW